MNNTVTSVGEHGTDKLLNQGDSCKLLLNGGRKTFEVLWDAAAKVTPMGSLVFFAQYLQTGGIMDRQCVQFFRHGRILGSVQKMPMCFPA